MKDVKANVARAVVLSVGLGLGLASLIDAQESDRGQSDETPVGAEPDIEAGAALYAESCATCHGAELEGQENWRIKGDDGRMPAPPHNADGHTWHHDDATLFAYTRLGGAAALAERGIAFDSGMPGFGDTLSDTQIRDILAYIKSTWPARERAFQQERTKAAQAAGN